MRALHDALVGIALAALVRKVGCAGVVVTFDGELGEWTIEWGATPERWPRVAVGFSLGEVVMEAWREVVCA